MLFFHIYYFAMHKNAKKSQPKIPFFGLPLKK